MTVRAPAMARRARPRSGKSTSGSAPSRTSTSIFPAAAASRMPAASRPGSAGTVGQTPSRNHSPAVVEPVRPGQQARARAPCRGRRARWPGAGRTGSGLREGGEDGVGGGDDAVGGLGQRRPAEDDRDRACGEERGGRRDGGRLDAADVALAGAGDERGDELAARRRDGAGAVAAASSETEVGCGASSMSVTPSLTTAWRRRRKRTGSSSLGSGPRSRTVPPGAQASSMVARGQAEHDLGREAVAQLGVDVVGADDALGELGPGVGVFVGEPGAAEHARPRRVGAVGARPHGLRQRVGPTATRRGRRPCADERCAEAVGAVDRLEAEAALVAEPAPVDRVDVDAQVAQDLVAGRLHRRCGSRPSRSVQVRLDLVEVPRAGLEAVRLGGERADRADLHGVAAEVGGERVVGEGVDLGLVAAVLEVDQRVAGDVLGEAGAAVAQDAALAVEGDEVADRDRLLEVALLLDEPALARAVGHRLVLQRALAALVADRAVERVVDEEELEDAVLGLLGDRRSRCRRPCRGATGIMQAGWSAGPRPVSISTRHMRHMPTGSMRGW